MRKRSDFVANSSGTSFTCEISGASVYGWDFSLDDAGYAMCENEHVMLNEYALDITAEILRRALARRGVESAAMTPDELWSEYTDNGVFGDCFPEEACPICLFMEVSTSDLKFYLMRTTEITTDEVFEHIRSTNKRRRKLYDGEYVSYVLAKTGKTASDMLAEIKERFGNYHTYMEFLHEK